MTEKPCYATRNLTTNASSLIFKNFPLPPISDLFGKGSVAFITGGTKGLGYHTAEGLAKRGITVLIAGRDATTGKEAAAKLTADGGLVEFVQLDLTDHKSIDVAVKSVEDKYGKLDILINNAGIADPFDAIGITKETVDSMRRIYETNVFAPFALVKTFLPLLRKSKHPRIVNVSSGLGSLTYCSTPNTLFSSFQAYAYNSSKSALNMLTVEMANELGKDGFKVNATDPGYCATDLNHNSGPRSAQQGAVVTIHMALVGDDGPNGSYYNDAGRNYW